MIAYICEQGAKISREGHRLVVTTQVMKRTLFIERLEQLLIFLRRRTLLLLLTALWKKKIFLTRILQDCAT